MEILRKFFIHDQSSPSSIPHDLSRFEIAQVISKKLFYRGFYYRREKMTYNKKLMWKCISYSKFKCHSRIHTYDGRIIFNSDKHNHLPHSLEKDQSVFHSSTSQANQKTVYRDGHDFMGRSYVSETDSTPSNSTPGVGDGSNRKRRTSGDGKNVTPKLSLTKNICFNLQNITKPLPTVSGEQNMPKPLLKEVGKTVNPIVDRPLPISGLKIGKSIDLSIVGGKSDVSSVAAAMALKENNPNGDELEKIVNSKSKQISIPTDDDDDIDLEDLEKKLGCIKSPLNTKMSSIKDKVSGSSNKSTLGSNKESLSSSNNKCDTFNEILPCNTTVDLTSHVFSDTITEVPNSLGKLTKCAVKQELITCTPEIC
ncbi:hypothetical protein WDU94_001111 [Cyamophila willieti]